MRDEGYTVEVVERWNAFAKIRQDLFGFVDLVAVRDSKTYGIQTTSYSNISARVNKINDSPIYPRLKEAGWDIQVWGWKKNKSNRWEVKIREM